MTEDELQYYLVCNETCYPNPFAEFESDANVALDTIMTQQGVVRMFANNNGLGDVQVGGEGGVGESMRREVWKWRRVWWGGRGIPMDVQVGGKEGEGMGGTGSRGVMAEG